MTEQEIRDLFKSKNVPLGASDVWKVQQALVVKHKALERLAAELKIRFSTPKVIRAEADECVICVEGHFADGGDDGPCEWSFGEARIGLNYQVSGKQAGYPYAMAEKRAKDRVILKLAGLHGAYSEDEADDFKQSEASPPATNPTFDRIKSRLEAEGSNVDAILQDEGATIAALPEDLKARLRTIVRFVREARKVAA